MMFPKQHRHSVRPGARVVVLGDPHGDLRTARAIVERERAVDKETVVVCVGDAIGYRDGPASSAMVEWLAEQGIPTVSGNHEEWYFHQVQLSVVDDRRADRRLSDAAAEWIARLPHRVDLVDANSGNELATIVHSIRTPHWDDVAPHSAARLMRELTGVRVVLIGHSHCPRVMKFDRHGAVSLEGFDYTRDETREVDISRAPAVIVDAGSISRPRADLRQLDRRSGFGTYLVVDPGRGVAIFQRIGKVP